MIEGLKQFLQSSKKNLLLLYVLYLCGVVSIIFPLFGALMVYLNKKTSDSLLASHYNFLFRTFIISFISCCCIFIAVTLIGPVTAKVLVKHDFEVVLWLLLGLFIALGILWLIWFVLRLFIGLNYIINDQAHPNPSTFWIK